MLDKIRAFIAANGLFQPGDRVGVAVSGGVDSICLLHALMSLPELALELTVCHLDHGLRPESPRDAKFVREVCARRGLPCLSARLEVRAFARSSHLSLEMAARELRYTELRRMAGENGLARVALGHHRDDQAETVLLRILRGTGLEGLAGMAAIREDGLFVRPLLGVGRAEILVYAGDNGLNWVEDATNRETGILRNRVRHVLLPALRAEYNPGIDRALLSLSALAREAGSYFGRDLDAAWPELRVQPARGGVIFSPTGLAGLSPPLARLALRRLLALAGGDPGRLSSAATRRIWEFTQGAGGPRLSVPGGFTLTRRNRHLFLGRVRPAAPLPPRPLPVPGEAGLPDGRLVTAAWWLGNPPDWSGVSRKEAFLDGEALSMPLAVRSRRPGDRFRPLGLGGAKKIKEALIEAKVPREEREAVPIVTDSRDRVVWVAGLRLDERFRITGATRRILRLSLEDGADKARPLS